MKREKTSFDFLEKRADFFLFFSLSFFNFCFLSFLFLFFVKC